MFCIAGFFCTVRTKNNFCYHLKIKYYVLRSSFLQLIFLLFFSRSGFFDYKNAMSAKKGPPARMSAVLSDCDNCHASDGPSSAFIDITKLKAVKLAGPKTPTQMGSGKSCKACYHCMR